MQILTKFGQKNILGKKEFKFVEIKGLTFLQGEITKIDKIDF